MAVILSEVELLQSAYGSQVVIDESTLQSLSEAISTGQEPCEVVCIRISLGQETLLTLQLLAKYPDVPLHVAFVCSNLRNSQNADISAKLNDMASKNCAECCCFQIVQSAVNLWTALGEQETLKKKAKMADISLFEPPRVFRLARVLIYFHHIKSPMKMKEIVDNSSVLDLGGLWKIDFPGIVLIEGSLDSAMEFVRRIQRLHWQHMVVRGEEIGNSNLTHEELNSERVLPQELKLVESMSCFGQECQRRGCHELFMKIMKT